MEDCAGSSTHRNTYNEDQFEEFNQCGCKGIRTCRFCIFSLRARNVKFEKTYEKYADYKCYLFNNKEGCSVIDRNLNVHSSLADIQRTQAATDSSERLKIPGILLVEEFITEEEEKFLTCKIDNMSWQLSQSGRRKQDFGPQVNFKKRKVKVSSFNGIPDYADALLVKLDKIFANDRCGSFELFEMCNLEYTPKRNACIEMHKDDSWIWGERLIRWEHFHELSHK